MRMEKAGDTMTVNYKQIGERIRQARLEKGLTQEQVAEQLDVGVTHISHIETGNTIPSMKFFIGIVDLLGVSADSLLCDNLAKAKVAFTGELAKVTDDCSEEEIRIIADMAKQLKTSLRTRRQR